ncbi:MAG: hypothetical protein VXA63_06245, partial [Euryarchaeota archaeon]
MAIGKPQIIMTLGLRCKINIVIATNIAATGSIFVSYSEYLAFETYWTKGVCPVTVVAFRTGRSWAMDS